MKSIYISNYFIFHSKDINIKNIYKLYKSNMSWENTQEYFKNIKGNLAIISSQKMILYTII